MPIKLWSSILWTLCLSGWLRAESPTWTVETIRAAVARSLSSIEAGSSGSADQRTCFTCHSQAMPVLALTEAKRHGFTIDEANYQRQLRHTYDHLQRGLENYQQAKGQGGGVLTAGYALWTLEAGKWERDATLAAVTHYLLEQQVELRHWRHRGNRPPSSGSDHTATYVALRALAYYGSPDQAQKIADRKSLVKPWLLEDSPADIEDAVFRFKSLKYVAADISVSQKAMDDLIRRQGADGGWSQTSEMTSDAYATATVVETLLGDGGLTIEHPSLQRAVAYLLRTQLDDGTWRVTTRAKPFQEYFESGFPHGEDQFISISATAWSILALLATLPTST